MNKYTKNDLKVQDRVDNLLRDLHEEKLIYISNNDEGIFILCAIMKILNDRIVQVNNDE